MNWRRCCHFVIVGNVGGNASSSARARPARGRRWPKFVLLGGNQRLASPEQPWMLTHEPRTFFCFDKSSIIRKLRGAAEERAPRVTQSWTEALRATRGGRRRSSGAGFKPPPSAASANRQHQAAHSSKKKKNFNWWGEDVDVETQAWKAATGYSDLPGRQRPSDFPRRKDRKPGRIMAHEDWVPTPLKEAHSIHGDPVQWFSCAGKINLKISKNFLTFTCFGAKKTDLYKAVEERTAGSCCSTPSDSHRCYVLQRKFRILEGIWWWWQLVQEKMGDKPGAFHHTKPQKPLNPLDTPWASIGTNLFKFKTDTLSLCFSLRRRRWSCLNEDQATVVETNTWNT